LLGAGSASRPVASAATSALAAGWYRSSGCAHVLVQDITLGRTGRWESRPVLRHARAGMLAARILIA
jgi:hypothetical protein